MKTKIDRASSFAFCAATTVALAVPFALLGSGCGGANNAPSPLASGLTASRKARASVSIQWPTREGRLIPVASNSVRITFTNTSGFRASQVIARPATSVSFDNLPPGKLTVTATAHADSTGDTLPAQASSIQVINATVDTPFALNLTMASTIERLLLTQSVSSVYLGQSAIFAVSAQDGAGNTVLTSGNTYQWTTSDTAIASVQPGGASATITGAALGNANINVTETESGKTTRLPLTVSQPVPVSSGMQAVTYQINTSHTGSIAFGQPLNFPSSPTWSVDLGGKVSYPLIVGGKVYVTTTRSDGKYGTILYALDATTGQNVWGPVTVDGGYAWSGIAYDRGKIFLVNGDGLVRSFDAATGAAGWSAKLTKQYSFDAPPTAANGILYVGGAGSGGTLFAVDESSGATLWDQSVENGDISSPTLSPEGDGVFVSYPDQVYKFNPQNGTPLWHYDGGGEGGGGKTSAYANRLLYVRDSPYDFTGTVSSTFVFNALTGALVPGTNIGGRNVDPIAALGSTTGYFLVGTSYQGGGSLQGIDLASRRVLWSFAGDGNLTSAPLLIDQTVIAASGSGVVYALDAATGAVKWQGAAGDSVLHPDEQNVSQPLTGLGAGEGYLVVPASNRLTCWHIVN